MTTDCHFVTRENGTVDVVRGVSMVSIFDHYHDKKIKITKIDVSITTQREKDTLGILSSYAIDTIIRFLLQDISRDNNVIKSYQSLVAHTVFPRRKGRPSVDDSDDDS